MIKKYRTKSTVIEAAKFNGSFISVKKLFGEDLKNIYIANQGQPDCYILIPTPEGAAILSVGDWLIKDVKGELYPCQDDIFRETYEEVKE